MIVQIAGHGLAELTVARILARRRHQVHLTVPEPGPARPLIVEQETAALLHELWEDDLLTGGRPLLVRQVRWARPEPARSARPAVAIDGETIATRMQARLADLPQISFIPAADPSWTITAAFPADRRPVQMGRRHLLAATTPLGTAHEPATTLLETVPSGWIHLFPIGAGQAVVQAMVPGPAAHPLDLLTAMLDESGLLEHLAEPPRHAIAIPAAPRLLPVAALSGHITVGAGALRLDPLSGTGTAQAIRTAILAAALVTSAGSRSEPFCSYYNSRLTGAFTEHVNTCGRLYAEAFPGPDWCDERVHLRSTPQHYEFRLAGDRLVRI